MKIFSLIAFTTLFLIGNSLVKWNQNIYTNAIIEYKNLNTELINESCTTGSFGLKTDFAIGQKTGPQVDCYDIWTDYTLRMVANKPQWTSTRYGTNFYANNAMDEFCYTCQLGAGKFSPGAVQNWKGPDGRFSRYICKVVNENGKIQAKWVFIALCN